MKKIVALVLSLALALSLCTVAFAADSYKLFDVNGDEAVFTSTAAPVEFKAAAVAKDGKWGNLACYTDGTYYYAIVAKDKAECSIKTADGVVYLSSAMDKNAAYGVIFYAYNAEKVGKASIWSCENGLHEAGYKYVDENGNTRYAVDAEVDGYAVLVGEKIVFVKDMIGAIPGTHVLYQTKTEAVRPNVYEYKCACCGKTFYGSTFYPNAAESAPMYYAFSGIMATMDFNTFWGKIDAQVAMPKYTEIVKTNMWIWAADSDAAAPAADKGTTSPKTFDAGIAMYVGLSLMSVAGSAVVIGKKKEF